LLGYINKILIKKKILKFLLIFSLFSHKS